MKVRITQGETFVRPVRHIAISPTKDGAIAEAVTLTNALLAADGLAETADATNWHKRLMRLRADRAKRGADSDGFVWIEEHEVKES